MKKTNSLHIILFLFLDVRNEIKVKRQTHKGFGFPDLGDLVGEGEACGEDVAFLQGAREHLIFADVDASGEMEEIKELERRSHIEILEQVAATETDIQA